MRAAWGLWAVAMLAGCGHDTVRTSQSSTRIDDNIHLPQSQRYARPTDAGPVDPARAHARVAELPQPVPTVEPRSRYGNGPVYTVNGHSYHVLDSARGYHERGIASWYGLKFQGHLTSSMERYDMYKFTAAHTTLPLPTWVRVTNLGNGKSVIVRVNDRGPFHGDRLIDLSWAAAARIGMLAEGTALVDVRAIDPRQSMEPTPTDVVTSPGHKPRLYLQAGAYARPDNARAMLARLSALGIDAAKLQYTRVDGRSLSRVRIGPLEDVAALDRLSRFLRRHGIDALKVEIESSPEE